MWTVGQKSKEMWTEKNNDKKAPIKEKGKHN